MTNEVRQAELKRHRTLLFAILDYHLKHYIGSMVFDDWDPSVDYYLREKERTEKDYQESKLDSLAQRLDNFVKSLQVSMDTNFETYVKEQTDYELDVFGDLRRKVATVISKGKVSNDSELRDVNQMIQIYRTTSLAEEQIDILVNLVHEFSNQKNASMVSHKVESEVKYFSVQINTPPPTSEPTSTEGKIDTVKKLNEAEFTEFQRKLGWISSPSSNGRQIFTRANGKGDKLHTEVSIVLKGGSGCIYCVKGESLLISAYWKNDNTVVIETKKEYIADVKCDKVSSFEDVVNIEYIESLA